MGGISLSRLFGKISLKRLKGESFVVLDVGTFSVKALHIEARNDHHEIAARAFKPHVASDINADGSFNASGITNTCREVLSQLREANGKTQAFPKKSCSWDRRRFCIWENPKPNIYP